MEWKVTNAVNRDVERQHLNKILKEVESGVASIKSDLASTTGAVSSVQNTLTQTIVKTINSTITPADLTTKVTLTGDVVGVSSPVSGKNEVVISTVLSGNFLQDAPSDGYPYWRRNGQWEAVDQALSSIGEIEGSGFAVWDEDTLSWSVREIEVADTARLTVTYGDGTEGNPVLDLALVPNSGTGTAIYKQTIDSYGRVTGYEQGYAADLPVATLGTPTINTVQEVLSIFGSPGLLWGGNFSDAGSGNLAYAAMEIAIRASDSDKDPLYIAAIAGGTIAIPADGSLRFVGVQYNAGTPIVVLKTSDSWDMDTEFPLGTAYNLSGTLYLGFNPMRTADAITNIVQRFDGVARFARDATGGLVLSTDGTTRNLARTGAKVWHRLDDNTVAAADSTTLPLFRIEPTSPLTYTPGYTAWPNTEYLSGTTYTTMTNNRWAVLYIYVNVETGAWGFATGQAQYLSLSEATQDKQPSYLTDNFFRQNMYIGRLIFEKSATTATIQSAFVDTPGTASVSNHNNLGGLQGGAAGDYQHLTTGQLANVDLIDSDPGALPWVLKEGDTMTGPLIINQNAAPSGQPGLEVFAEAANGASEHANVTATTYGYNGGGTFHGRFANGTRAAPSGVLNNQIFAGIGGRPYTSAGVFCPSSPTSIHWVAKEDLTGSGNGSCLRILTTAVGSTYAARVVTAVFSSDHDLIVGPVDDIPESSLRNRGLAVVRDGTSEVSQWVASASSGFNAGWRAVAHSGTIASPAQTLSGQSVFLGFGGRDTAGTLATGALIKLAASEAWTTTARGADISFEGTPSGSTTRSTLMTIKGSGSVGIGTATPNIAGDSNLHLTLDAGTASARSARLNLVGNATSDGGVRGVIQSYDGSTVVSQIVMRRGAGANSGTVYFATRTAAGSLSSRLGIIEDGVISIGGAVDSANAGGASSASMYIQNCSAEPTSTPSGGGVLYVYNGALKYKGSSGTVTTIANA